MKYVKTFENFEYLLEADEALAGGKTSPEETKKTVVDITSATKAEMGVKSAFSQKLKSKIAQAQAQAQSEREKPQKESFIFESAEGGEILSKENMQQYADALVKRLPILYSGDREVRFHTGRGVQEVPIPAGAEYEAYKAEVYERGVTVRYKDITGKYQEVSLQFNPSKEEIAHISNIYSEFGKKLAKRQKWAGLLSKTAKIAIPLGVVAALAGMVIQGSSHGSGSEPYRAISDITIAGGAAFAGGLAAAGALRVLDKKIDVAEEAIGMFSSLIKAFCDSLDISMMELKTIGDINELFSIEKVEVEVENKTTSGKVESVGNRLKGFKRF
jgi:hypothetical protein